MDNMPSKSIASANRRGYLWRKFCEQRFFQVTAILGIVFIFFISYASDFGLLMAFKNYAISDGIVGIFTKPFIGFKNFTDFFADSNFGRVLRNTLAISFLKLFFSFPAPIIFAIAVTEMRFERFKRTVQTVSYLPHFISWVVVAGMLNIFLLPSDMGLLNSVLLNLGFIKEPISYLTEPSLFWIICVISDIWKECGWWAIIFIAAIAGIDPGLYEAISLDGAKRLQKIWYITLPGIKGAIGVVLIISLGNLFTGGMSGSNFDQSFLLGNVMTVETSEIIPTYVYKMGILQGRFSYATAIGMLQSLVSLILIFGSNYISKKMDDSNQGLLF